MTDNLQDRIAEHHKANQYTVTREQIETILDDARSEEKIFFGKSMVIAYILPNGFVIHGQAAVVNETFFSEDLGRRKCREDAIRQIFALEGYLMQAKFAESKS